MILKSVSCHAVSGGSEPTPLFSVIVGPSVESKGFGEGKKELAKRHILRLKFWEQLLSRAKEKGALTPAQRSPSKDMWISAGTGFRAGVSLTYIARVTEQMAVEVSIDTGDREENQRIFDALHSRKAEIEKAFGSPLSWARLDDRRSSRVRSGLSEGGLVDEVKWSTIQDAMIEAMDKLAKAVKPHLGTAGSAPLLFDNSAAFRGVDSPPGARRRSTASRNAASPTTQIHSTALIIVLRNFRNC